MFFKRRRKRLAYNREMARLQRLLPNVASPNKDKITKIQMRRLVDVINERAFLDREKRLHRRFFSVRVINYDRWKRLNNTIAERRKMVQEYLDTILPEKHGQKLMCGCGKSKNQPFCDDSHLECKDKKGNVIDRATYWTLDEKPPSLK